MLQSSDLQKLKASREGRGIPGNEALQSHQQRGKQSDNQYFPSFQVKKKRGAALLEPPPLGRDRTLPCCVHSHSDPREDPDLPERRKELLPRLPPSDKGLGPSQSHQLQVPSAPSVCPCAGPWSWPQSHRGHARALGLFRGLGCPVLRPPLLRFQAGRASPCSHRTVSRQEAGNRGHPGGHSSCSTIRQDTDFWGGNQQGGQGWFWGSSPVRLSSLEGYFCITAFLQGGRKGKTRYSEKRDGGSGPARLPP